MCTFGAPRPLLLSLAALSIVLAACGASNFDRADAISALQSSGATNPQATCIADTLIEMGELGSADPRAVASDQDRENLSVAHERCVATEVLPEFDVEVTDLDAEPPSSALGEPVVSGGGFEEVEAEATAEVETLTSSPEELREDAINKLVGLGRSESNATCVVDNLLAQGATDIVTSVDLGLGLDIREASAFAACP